MLTMKWIKYLYLLLVHVGCHRVEKVSPEALKPLVGRWQLVDSAGGGSYPIVIIRYDGLLLDSHGSYLCCGPRMVRFNGTEYPFEPREQVPSNETCALNRCVAWCPVWDIALDGNALVLTDCWGGRSRYARMR